MKKILLLIVMTFLMTGCSVDKLDDTTINKLVEQVVNKNSKLSNRVGIGYNYYIPNGVSLLEVTEENEVLYANSNKYYLYIDLISYQKKTVEKYSEDKTLYFSKEIKSGKKTGYIQIEKVNNQYFIEMMYNYAKIEAYVYSHQLEDSVLDISYILSSIKYNDGIINSLIAEKKVNKNGNQFNVLKPVSNIENTYLDNIEANLIDTGSVINDPDVLNINLNE